MRQIALLPSGCQVYPLASKGCTTSNESYIIFASTLVVYVYNARTFLLEKIIQDKAIKKSISSIANSPHDENLLAVCSLDGNIIIWKIKEEIVAKRLLYKNNNHMSLLWCPNGDSNSLYAALIDQSALKILMWQIDETATMNTVVSIKIKSDDTKITAARWHPKVSGLIAVGTTRGELVLYSIEKKSLKPLTIKDRGAVIDAQWDPLSSTYLLVAYSSCISLWDGETGAEIHLFDSQPGGISAIAWMNWAAGSFISTNNKNGTIRIWNVSQKRPLKLVKACKEGVNAATFGVGNNSTNLVLASTNGSIVVYNMHHMQEELYTPASHTETIFDCKFSPSTPDIFASCSYDGTIKLWQSSNFQLIHTLHAGEIVYSCEWSPDGKYILAGSITGKIFLWETKSGREMGYLHHHTKSTYCISWNRCHKNIVCSTSGDGSCVVFEIDVDSIGSSGSRGSGARTQRAPGTAFSTRVVDSTKLDCTIRMRYTNSGNAAMFGVSWSPTAFNLLVIGSQDGHIRLLDMTRDQPVLCLLVGHESRSFHCTWSPIIPGMLASGGDDHKVLVWCLDLEKLEMDVMSTKKDHFPFPQSIKPTKELQGHTSKVRALVWNHELKHILLSGSWDATIRIWHVDAGLCLRVVTDHIADVYSLQSHPHRPFLYLSCSRDSTIRQWELQDVFSLIRTYAVVDLSMYRVLDSDRQEMGINGPRPVALLCGQRSRAVHKNLTNNHSAQPCIELAVNYYHLFNFLRGSGACLDLWECAVALLYEQDSRSPLEYTRVLLRDADSRVVLPGKEMRLLALSSAKKLESKRMGAGRGDLSAQQQEGLRQAALAFARSGEMAKYCSIMVEIGEWEKAISVAPCVSMDLWKSLTAQYASVLAKDASEQCVPHLIAIGEEDAAVQFFLRRKHPKSALIVALGPDNPRSIHPAGAGGLDQIGDKNQRNSSMVLRSAIDSVVVSMIAAEDPVRAASYYLAFGFSVEAVGVLEASQELDLAYALSVCLGLPTHRLIVLMADYLLDQHGSDLALDLALDLLGKLPSGGDSEKSVLMSRYARNTTPNTPSGGTLDVLLSDGVHGSCLSGVTHNFEDSLADLENRFTPSTGSISTVTHHGTTANVGRSSHKV